MDHIDDMDQLRQGIGLQAYGQRDPKVEYKMQAYEMFDSMIAAIQETTLRLLYHVRLEQKVEREQVAQVLQEPTRMKFRPKKPETCQRKRWIQTTPALAAAVENKQCCGRKPI